VTKESFLQPKARKIKVETIVQKIICGRAIQRNGFVYDYLAGSESDTSDEEKENEETCLQL
jgi:hypothetical protein